MLSTIFSLLLSWLNIGQPSNQKLQPLELLPWHDTALFSLPSTKQDLIAEKNIELYLQKLTQQGVKSDRQGIWIQSGWQSLATNQGNIPLPAASLTKIATTLAAVHQFSTEYRFDTKVYFTGEIQQGVVTGDVIVEGSGDPLFVWEEAIALGNTLQELGIKQVRGDLLVTDKFYMNYRNQPLKAGTLLREGWDRDRWSPEATQQYLQMPQGTAQPKIAIAGKVKSISVLPSSASLLVTHKSLPLVEILRQMNIYSNNKMAQMLTDSIGGAEEVARISAEIAEFPKNEISLINGSGLGEENIISPRGVVQMSMKLDRLLAKDSLNLSDIFPTAGRDFVGTVSDRGLPPGTAVKTGTLDHVSALAGVIPTRDRGQVYFAIVNYGRQYQYFRQQQDWLLNQLVQKWQLVPHTFSITQNKSWFLGNPQRNQVH